MLQHTGIITATGGNAHPHGGGGSGGIITLAYDDAFMRQDPVAHGGTGWQHGAAGIVHLRRRSAGDLHSQVIVPRFTPR